MPKIEGSEVQQVYAMAHAFVDAALRNDGSLFTPERPVISEGNLEDLHARFVEHPDLSSRAFEDKLRDQLAGAGPETIQLAGELLYVHFLGARNIYGAAKRGVIDRILAWSRASQRIPEPLAQALDKGIASVDTAFNTLRPNQLAFLI